MSLKDLAVATAVLLAAAAPAAIAQDDAQPAGPSGQYSDEDVDAFVEAVDAVAALDEEWRPRIEAAGDPEEAQQLAVQSQTEMAAAIEEAGITVEDYNEIYASAQADPRLADRIRAALQERDASEEPGG